MKMKNKKGRIVLSLLSLGFVGVLVSSQAFGEESSGSTSFWEKTKVTGGIDVNYNYNFNRPTTTAAAAAANGYRLFDANANTFNIALAELAIENSPVDWVTLRTDLDFGRDTALFHAAGLGTTEFFDLQQAYVVLKAPVGNGLSFKIGKFVTMHGAEVIEAWANNNISRGLLFNYAIPFTHTGVLVSYPFADWLMADVGVVNGWNNVIDNNNGKSVHAMLTVKPIDKLTWIVGGTFGPELAGSDGTIAALLDTSLIYALRDNLTFTLNYNLGRNSGQTIGSAPAAGGTNGVADWQGVAAYAHWVPLDMFGLTLRGEYYDDDVGTLGAPTGATASGRLFEGTLTSHLYLADGLDLRFEFRHDQGNNASFLRGNGASRKFQDTIASQLVYAF